MTFPEMANSYDELDAKRPSPSGRLVLWSEARSAMLAAAMVGAFFGGSLAVIVVEAVLR